MSRRAFTDVQLEALENEFNKSNYHDVFSREDLAHRMELPEQRSQVCVISFVYIIKIFFIIWSLNLIRLGIFSKVSA